MMTTTNATSKYKEAFGNPTSIGIDARKIATAPRSPVQAMKLFSRQLKRNGARQRNTATGRATSIRTTATITAGTTLTTSRCGDTNSPSSTNITICASQVAASRNVTTELCARVGRFPIMMPARYTARNPEAGAIWAAPKITSAAVVTNGACNPCGSATRLSATTTMRPPITPTMAPNTASRPNSIATCHGELSPTEINFTRTSVRKTANGSLVPDSASSVAPTRGRSRSPCVCTSRKTAAASVEATTAPTSSDSGQLRASAYLATGAVITAVNSTPMVASAIEGASTARML